MAARAFRRAPPLIAQWTCCESFRPFWRETRRCMSFKSRRLMRSAASVQIWTTSSSSSKVIEWTRRRVAASAADVVDSGVERSAVPRREHDPRADDAHQVAAARRLGAVRPMLVTDEGVLDAGGGTHPLGHLHQGDGVVVDAAAEAPHERRHRGGQRDPLAQPRGSRATQSRRSRGR